MYHDPNTVLSPRQMIKSVEVKFDLGPVPGSWSVATLTWGDAPAVGIRWNGDEQSSEGLPQTRGNPTWFIVPKELADAVLNAAREAGRMRHTALEEGYKRMAEDREREAEADEWTEALIGDVD